MQRISSSTAVAVLPPPILPAPGTPGFFAQIVPGQGVPTVMTVDWCNGIQEELIACILSAGLTPNPALLTQVRDGLMAFGYFADTGAANAYAIATSVTGQVNGVQFIVPAIEALAKGTRLLILAKTTNTAASTLAIDTNPAVNWVNNAGGALAAGDIVGGSIYQVLYDGAAIRMVAPTNSQLMVMIVAANPPVPTVPMQGASHTYANADAKETIWRSNGGAAMTDTLPGAAAGALAAGFTTTVVNTDVSLLSFQVGAGSTLSGANVTNGYVVIGAGQKVTITCDGKNYQVYGAPERARLGQATTLFVASGGSDAANVGIVSTSPFATRQHAYNWAQSSLDLAGFPLTISVAAGAYSDSCTCNGPLYGQTGAILFQGNGACSIAVTAGACFQGFNGSNIEPAGFVLSSTGPGTACLALAGSSSGPAPAMLIGPGLSFGASALAHMLVTGIGQFTLANPYTITGGASAHWNANALGSITNGNTAITVTLTGTPAFSAAFAVCTTNALINPLNLITFSGSATGARYAVSAGGTIDTNASGASYLPGSVAGSGTNYF
jgi:hypothetical protein